MDITPQEESMIKAFRETELPPLFVLIRLRNDFANDIGNVTENQRDVIVNTLETYIGPLWKENQEGNKSQVDERL
ncbi:hypothetical protein LOZ80_11035 [Paenibacillus sp. HWE-109]|uniref:hypothetical protein n=1 Tax=Paenibacillus sp. HWE-109 TaxID=1306526 RepID=UPI001EE0E922|nr:hypothetical protein [Paenibacillus sp. HWE-109]UKS29428.1 hypothetical protein LOZ80_11035 [Paenibacillus sp. HWE-109]